MKLYIFYKIRIIIRVITSEFYSIIDVILLIEDGIIINENA